MEAKKKPPQVGCAYLRRAVKERIHTMKNKKLVLVLIGVLILAGGIGVGAYATSIFGTESDPLVAKSYLDDVLTPKLQSEFGSQMNNEVKKLEQQINGVSSTLSGNFEIVTLSSGQTLQGSVGCEIVLRSGSATVAGTTGLSDLTSGTVISNGNSVNANHLCVVAGENEGVKASGTVTLLVRGVFKTA